MKQLSRQLVEVVSPRQSNDEINCRAINYEFGLSPQLSFGGGKRDGKLLQKFFYLSPTITNPQPNTAVCIHSAVCNLHSHMRELHTDSHIPTSKPFLKWFI